jgi:virulence-associated protein VagC
MKLDKDLFPANMNTIKLNGKKVLVWPSQVELTKGKEVIIGEERQSRMIMPKNLKIDRWKKNERSKQQSHPKVTFDVLMAKYRDGKADIRGRKNWTIWFPWIRAVLLRQEAHPATSSAHRHSQIQKVGIVINRSIIWCLTSRSGHQCLGRGGLRR